MTKPSFRTIVESSARIAFRVDGRRVSASAGRSLLAVLLIGEEAGPASDFFCAIGQCQRCAVIVDGRPALACMTTPKGGEDVRLASPDRRPAPDVIR